MNGASNEGKNALILCRKDNLFDTIRGNSGKNSGDIEKIWGRNDGY